MHPVDGQSTANLVIYYVLYLTLCLALIVGLGRIFHRSGRIFLADAFAGNMVLVQAVARLLDISFYLLSVGYVVLTYLTITPSLEAAWLVRLISVKIGGFLLVLGVAHAFNLLLLALFRQRRARGPEPAIEV